MLAGVEHIGRYVGQLAHIAAAIGRAQDAALADHAHGFAPQRHAIVGLLAVSCAIRRGHPAPTRVQFVARVLGADSAWQLALAGVVGRKRDDAFALARP